MGKYALNREQEYELITRYQKGDKQAGEDLLKANFGLIQAMIGDIVKTNEHDNDLREDLFQEGCMGFMAGVQTFDTSRGVNLSTFAKWHIKNLLYKYYTFKTRNIKYISTEGSYTLSYTFSRACSYVQAKHKGKLEWTELVNEVKKFLGATDDQMERVLQQIQGERSMSEIIGNPDAMDELERSLGSVLASNTDIETDVLYRLDTNKTYDLVLKAMKKHVPKDGMDIIRGRYLNKEEKTFAELSKRHDVTRQAIQLRLKHYLELIKYDVQNQIGEIEGV